MWNSTYPKVCGEAKVANRLLDGNALCILERKQLAVQPAHQRKAAEEWLDKTNALFFREADDLDREAQSPTAELFYQSQSYYYAQDAVEGARIRDRIQVRTDDQSWRILRAEQPAQIARGIHVHGHSGRLHPST
jgi:hypothetical protein